MPIEPRPDDQIISERISPVIEAVAERIHYAESRRANYSTMGGVLVAAAVTIFTFAWSAIDLLVLRWSATFGAVAMFLVGTATIWLFGQQTNRYPFTSATKTWKWFYRDALPDSAKFKIPWSSYSSWFWPKVQNRIRDEYEAQLPSFKERILQLKADETNATQDIEQLYVLHINELYKNQHLSHVRSLFNFGMILILVSILIGAFFGWHIQEGAFGGRDFVKNLSTGSEKLEIRLVTSPLAQQVQYIGRVTITNNGKAAISVGDLVAHDDEGWALPLANVVYFDKPASVAPNETLSFGFAFDAAAHVARGIAVLEVQVK